jgi:hypothetical protein
VHGSRAESRWPGAKEEEEKEEDRDVERLDDEDKQLCREDEMMKKYTWKRADDEDVAWK